MRRRPRLRSGLASSRHPWSSAKLLATARSSIPDPSENLLKRFEGAEPLSTCSPFISGTTAPDHPGRRSHEGIDTALCQRTRNVRQKLGIAAIQLQLELQGLPSMVRVTVTRPNAFGPAEVVTLGKALRLHDIASACLDGPCAILSVLAVGDRLFPALGPVSRSLLVCGTGGAALWA